MSEYTSTISVDKHNLDEECLHLPSQYDHWSSKEEIAFANWQQLITKRAVVKAKVSLYLRGLTLAEINKKFNLKLKNLTEQAYKDLVYLHSDTISITTERDKAHSEFAIAKAARQSLEKKKAMLEYLTSLHGQGYFIRVKGKEFKEHQFGALRKRLAKTIKEKKTRRIKWQ